MAKLNGIKTLDMQNGEITKIVYEGAEYAKTNEPVKEGDLFQLSKGHTVIGGEDNAFYQTYKDSDGDILIPTSAGGLASIVQRKGHGVAYRKISDVEQSKPTIQRVVLSLENNVAALKDEKKSTNILAVGERVKTSRISKWGYACDGMTGVIEENDLNNGHYYVRMDNRKGVYLKPTQVKKFEETIEFEGATYRKVDCEAREGDVVIFRKNTSVSVDIDKPYKVVFSNYGGGNCGPGVLGHYRVYKDCYGRTRETVDVYEPIEQAKYVPQEGDIVVITGNTNMSRNAIGDIGKIEKCNNDDGLYAVEVPGKPRTFESNGNWTCFNEMRKATPEEVEQYEQEAHQASFSLGDYVKVTDNFDDDTVNVGDICEIVYDDKTDLPFKLKRLSDGKTSGFMYAQGVVKATDEEVAKALKPKLKAGDFVKIVNSDEYFTDGTYEVFAQNADNLFVLDDDGDKSFQILKNSDNYEILSAEEAKWAKIGRKPNEFKKGDVVRVVAHANGKCVGEIGLIEDAGIIGEGGVGVRCGENYAAICWKGESVELLAPVESLF